MKIAVFHCRNSFTASGTQEIVKAHSDVHLTFFEHATGCSKNWYGCHQETLKFVTRGWSFKLANLGASIRCVYLF